MQPEMEEKAVASTGAIYLPKFIFLSAASIKKDKK